MPPLSSAAMEASAQCDAVLRDSPLSPRESDAPPARRSDWIRFVTFDPLSRPGERSGCGRAWLPEGRECWEGWIEEYLRASAAAEPLPPDEEAERFLLWLADSPPAVRDGRSAAAARDDWSTSERVALRQRLAHGRFQQRWRASLRRLPRLSPRSRWVATLNPIHVWATFAGPRRPGEAAPAAADVLFFPVGDEIRSVRLGLDAASVLRRLEHRGRTVRQLVRSAPDLTPEEGLELLRELCRAGAIAVG